MWKICVTEPTVISDQVIVQITSWIRVLQKLIVVQLIKKSNILKRVYNSWSLDPIPSVMNPVHILTFCIFNIIIPFTPSFPKLNVPFGFSVYSFLCIFLSHACYTPRPPHPPLFDHHNHVCWRIQIIILYNMHFFHPPLPSTVLGSNVLLSIMFSATIHTYSSKFPTHTNQKLIHHSVYLKL